MELFHYEDLGTHISRYNTYMISGSDIVKGILQVRNSFTNAGIRDHGPVAASSYFSFTKESPISSSINYVEPIGTAKQVTIKYVVKNDGTSENVTTLKYDAATNTYLKYIDDVAQTDALNDTQLAFENVLILSTTIMKRNQTANAPLAIDLTSGGSGFYCNNGKYIKIQWEYDFATAQFVIKYSYTVQDVRKTEILRLDEGKTFVSIISQTPYPIRSEVSFR